MLKSSVARLWVCVSFCPLVQDLIKETKRRFKFMNHQIEQLKDEITIMDHCLVRCYVLVGSTRHSRGESEAAD